MAGAGQPFFMPLAWPIGHVYTALTNDAEDKPPKPKTGPQLDVDGHLTSMFGAFRAFLMAYAAIHLCYSGYDYPGYGRAATFEFSWMWPIILRNLLATWIICGCWDFFLYFGFGYAPLKEKLHKYKINPIYPSNSKIAHDAFMTTIASLTGAAIEIMCCHYWSTGVFPMLSRDVTAHPVRNLLFAVTITHWRIPHFWLIHRSMHPWRTTRFPDIGKFLYRHVHSLHHQSYNPTAFSGTNMHPVESTLYYSACLLVVPFGCHPTVVIGCIFDCAVGAWLGHDGFQWPGSGDYFHQLHHANFDCNYGATHVPIDKWLGTYIGDKSELQKVWAGKPFGAEANETFKVPEEQLRAGAKHDTSSAETASGEKSRGMATEKSNTSTTRRRADSPKPAATVPAAQ
eukprot:TRINITY_DN79473_c0_g1_i1.p1 TRINITY_DN79473_c0_g1~~TRINITY_DN79473_c0_g1_i1.p1  ORF type:complete len:398 (+),score=46.64 TRINITY_DN79473_c0_g1_i1:111-1304(+)